MGFGSRFGTRWGSNGSQNVAKAAQAVPKGPKKHQRDRLDFYKRSGIFVLYSFGSGADLGVHLGPMLVQIPGSFAYVNEVYLSIAAPLALDPQGCVGFWRDFDWSPPGAFCEPLWAQLS